MSRTYHHDRRRFHPWLNRQCKRELFEQLVANGRTGFYFMDYSSNPGWWTRLMMNRPQRHQARMIERLCQKGETECLPAWPHKSKPVKYFW